MGLRQVTKRLNIKRKFVPVCGLVVRIPGYRTEMYCVSCEVRTDFLYVI
jgi:hypothetical protein